VIATNAYQRDYRSTRKDQFRDGHLRRTFGISQAEYDELLGKQGGGCRICGKRPGKISLHVDHDHETGDIRGLLCVGCNNALGQFRDDEMVLTRAIHYLGGDLPALVDELEIDGGTRDRARLLIEVSG
jgi:hypothetical protein